MLTKRDLEFLLKLCEEVSDNGYKVYEWTELNALSEDPMEVMKQLSADQQVLIKYTDSDEICFCLTDRARKTVEELKTTLEVEKLSKKAVIKSDSLGRTIVIDEEANKEREIKQSQEKVVSLKKEKRKRFFCVIMRFISDFIAGIIGGGVVLLVYLLVK